MPVKSAHPKKTKVKKVVAPAQNEEEKEEMVPVLVKSKIQVDIDEHDGMTGLDEKLSDDILGSDEESDELGLDDAGLEEELDPFNDKWEA